MIRPLRCLPGRDRGTRAFAAVALLVGAAWAEPQELGFDPFTVPSDWTSLVTRDESVGFSIVGGERALDALRWEELTTEERGYALMAIGTSGFFDERYRLERAAQEGRYEEREAAVLALGEVGHIDQAALGDAYQLLDGLVRAGDTQLAQCALLALARAGHTEIALRIASSLGHALTGPAAAILRFADDPRGSSRTYAAERLFELRWGAAQRYGTIGGQAWSVVLMNELKRDEAFLDAVVLTTAAELSQPGVRDHLLEILLADNGEERARLVARAVVRSMPVEIDRLISSRLWAPTGQQWQILVDEAHLTGVTSLMPELMRRGAQLKTVAPTIAGIVARGPSYRDAILSGLNSDSKDLKLRGAAALADAGLEDEMLALRALDEGQDIELNMAALAARLRLGQPEARELTERILARPDAYDARRTALVEALATTCRTAKDLDQLEELVPLVNGPDKGNLVAALALRNRPADRAIMRASFERSDPSSPGALRILRALGTFATQDDLAFLAELFPIEGHDAANVELTVGLARNGHPKIQPILQSAVWLGPWNRSLLAAAIVEDNWGLRLLEQWAAKPPASAASADVRRLGFAIGEWGGMEAVHKLSQRLGGGADRTALQGAVLGALAARTF